MTRLVTPISLVYLLKKTFSSEDWHANCTKWCQHRQKMSTYSVVLEFENKVE